MLITTLADHLNQLLEIEKVSDYCPNGLQVQGRSEVKHLITGVTACLQLLEQARDQQADAILVHHGYFWQNEPKEIVGYKYKRLKILLGADINLLAYHLPLDLHPALGNNAQIMHRLGVQNVTTIKDCQPEGILLQGELVAALSAVKFQQQLATLFGQASLHIANTNKQIKTIACCSGAAQGMISAAINAGVDAYITGEVSEHTVHEARESGIHFFACGHHATERFGVQAVGQHLADKFKIKHTFIDIPNPV